MPSTPLSVVNLTNRNPGPPRPGVGLLTGYVRTSLIFIRQFLSISRRDLWDGHYCNRTQRPQDLILSVDKGSTVQLVSDIFRNVQLKVGHEGRQDVNDGRRLSKVRVQTTAICGYPDRAFSVRLPAMAPSRCFVSAVICGYQNQPIFTIIPFPIFYGGPNPADLIIH